MATGFSSQPLSERESFAAIVECMVQILGVQDKLRSLNGEFNWSNIIGDYGELLAIEKYSLIPAARNTANFDAKTYDNRSVQIKTCRSQKRVGFRGCCDLMLVSYLADDGSIHQLYFGPFDPVLTNSGPSGRDNKRVISVAALRRLAEQFPQIEEPNSGGINQSSAQHVKEKDAST